LSTDSGTIGKALDRGTKYYTDMSSHSLHTCLTITLCTWPTDLLTYITKWPIYERKCQM